MNIRDLRILATAKVKETRQKVKNVTSVISDFDMPFFYPDEKEEYILKFGKETIAKYEKLLSELDIVRSKIDSITDRQGLESIRASTQAIKNLAAALSGRGLCGEMCYLVMAMLFRSGCPTVQIVAYENSDHSKSHGFLIIGNKLLSSPPYSPADFKAIPEGFLLVDPFLDLIIDARDAFTTENLFNKYIKLYSLNFEISIDLTKEAHGSQIESLYQQAESISKEVLRSTKLIEIDKKSGEIESIKKKEISMSTTDSGVFAPKGQNIKDQLLRITDEKWNYSKDKAILQSTDQKLIQKVIKHLRSEYPGGEQAIKAQSVPNSSPKIFVATIVNPNFSELQKVKKMESELNNTLRSAT